METYRLKMKVGNHEFEAEGPADVVKEQFQAFKELIATVPNASTVEKPFASAQSERDNIANANPSAFGLEKITRVDDRVVSLTARPETIEDALLLLLLGQRTFRGNDSVTGAEIIGGLKQSGYTVARDLWAGKRIIGQAVVIGQSHVNTEKRDNKW